MNARKACRIVGCSEPWEKYHGKDTPFCKRHLKRADENRHRYARKPGQHLAELRTNLAGLAAHVPDVPDISHQDWGAFLDAIHDYRNQALDAAFTSSARRILDGLGWLERRLVREQCAKAAGEVPYAEVLDLDLVPDPSTSTGWRVELRPPLEWRETYV